MKNSQEKWKIFDEVFPHLKHEDEKVKIDFSLSSISAMNIKIKEKREELVFLQSRTSARLLLKNKTLAQENEKLKSQLSMRRKIVVTADELSFNGSVS